MKTFQVYKHPIAGIERFAKDGRNVEKLVDDIKEYSLVKTKKLRPIEYIFDDHFKYLEARILEDDQIKQPIIIDQITGAVLDGSHRYIFLVKHGYQLAPVVSVDYSNESIFVGNHLAHRYFHDENKTLTKLIVRSIAINGNLLPARTTRHFFPFKKEDIPTSLSKLNKKEGKSIEKFIDKATSKEQLKASSVYLEELAMEKKIINDYLEELAMEKEIINDYLLEQDKVTEYLKRQIASIKLKK